MNILDRIVVEKKNHEIYLKQKIEKRTIRRKKSQFIKTIKNDLAKGKNALIVEFKRFSPSVNKFKRIINLQEIIRDYEKSKCSCISILTDKNFGGSLNDIVIAKKISSKPILRKDFIVNKSQILESKIYGADAILLIAKILSKKVLNELYVYANKIGLDVLIEIENEEEIKKIKYINPELIGVNNRNLRKQKIDINNSINLSTKLKNKIIISESGINNTNIKRIKSNSNISSFLIGGSILNNNKKINFINNLYNS